MEGGSTASKGLPASTRKRSFSNADTAIQEEVLSSSLHDALHHHHDAKRQRTEEEQDSDPTTPLTSHASMHSPTISTTDSPQAEQNTTAYAVDSFDGLGAQASTQSDPGPITLGPPASICELKTVSAAKQMPTEEATELLRQVHEWKSLYLQCVGALEHEQEEVERLQAEVETGENLRTNINTKINEATQKHRKLENLNEALLVIATNSEEAIDRLNQQHDLSKVQYEELNTAYKKLESRFKQDRASARRAVDEITEKLLESESCRSDLLSANQALSAMTADLKTSNTFELASRFQEIEQLETRIRISDSAYEALQAQLECIEDIHAGILEEARNRYSQAKERRDRQQRVSHSQETSTSADLEVARQEEAVEVLMIAERERKALMKKIQVPLAQDVSGDTTTDQPMCRESDSDSSKRVNAENVLLLEAAREWARHLESVVEVLNAQLSSSRSIIEAHEERANEDKAEQSALQHGLEAELEQSHARMESEKRQRECAEVAFDTLQAQNKNLETATNDVQAAFCQLQVQYSVESNANTEKIAQLERLLSEQKETSSELIATATNRVRASVQGGMLVVSDPKIKIDHLMATNARLDDMLRGFLHLTEIHMACTERALQESGTKIDRQNEVFGGKIASIRHELDLHGADNITVGAGVTDKTKSG